jgi:methionyl aminopeptidase
MEQYVSVTPQEAMQARDGTIKLHGAEGFDGMRKAGRLAAEILDALVPHDDARRSGACDLGLSRLYA